MNIFYNGRIKMIQMKETYKYKWLSGERCIFYLKKKKKKQENM